MRKQQIIGLIGFIIGLIFKTQHYPGSSLLLIIGTSLILIDSLIFLFKNAKQNLSDSLLFLTFSIWTIYLLFRIQYWSCGPFFLGFSLLFVISTLLTFSTFITLFTEGKTIRTPQILLIIYFVFSFLLANIHSDRIYYFFNLNQVFEKQSRIDSYYAWDKYSWFLYRVEKQDEAIEANLKAQQIIEKRLKFSQERELIMSSEKIRRHGQLIRDKNWNSFEGQ